MVLPDFSAMNVDFEQLRVVTALIMAIYVEHCGFYQDFFEIFKLRDAILY